MNNLHVRVNNTCIILYVKGDIIGAEWHISLVCSHFYCFFLYYLSSDKHVCYNHWCFKLVFISSTQNKGSLHMHIYLTGLRTVYMKW